MLESNRSSRVRKIRWQPAVRWFGRWVRVAMLLMVGALCLNQSAGADEGLFRPEQVAVPFDKERLLKSIIRIKSHTYFSITVFNNTQDASIARATARKVFLPEGITIWPIVLDKPFLDRLQIEPGLRLLPAYYEIARAFEGETTFPSQRIVPLEGAGTGFFISPDGYFLTSYHVVKEEIEAASQAGDSGQPWLCRYLEFEIPVVEDGRIISYQPLKNVRLIRHVSEAEAKAGFDAAVLKADMPSPAFLEPDLNGVIADMPVWTAGFPIRTQRDAQRRAELNYADADGSLRLTQGKVQQSLSETNFSTTADGLSGSTGGPTVNQQGQVIGLVRGVYPEREENRRAVVFVGGLNHIDIRAVMARLKPEGDLNPASR